METTPRRADCDVSDAAPGLPTGADAYLERLSKEQTRFLGALAEANTMLPRPPSQLARVAAIQSRLAQEFLDAQRAIIKRRAETEAAVVGIAASAESESDALFAQARSASVAASVSGSMPHPAPSGSPVAKPAPVMARTPGAATAWPAPGTSSDVDSLARLIDGAFEGAEPDGAAMKRQLRELLDEWWRIENQEDKAAIDDANARAAMRVHVATVESNQIVEAAAVRKECAAPRFTYEPPKHVPPLVAALDTTNHEDLDEMLSSLLDALDAPIGLPADQADAVAPIDDTVPSADVAPIVDARILVIDTTRATPLAAPTAGPVPVLPPNPLVKAALPFGQPDSLNDETAAPQEAFDRFWGTLTARRSRGRDWVLMQVLFPAVAVIAVLALVLAVVG